MTYKDIEGSRNIRLWFVQVVVPLTSLAATTLMALPEARHAMSSTVGKINNSVRRLFKKESKSKKLILVMDAKNKEEALYVLETMRREIIVKQDNTVPIKMSVHLKD